MDNLRACSKLRTTRKVRPVTISYQLTQSAGDVLRIVVVARSVAYVSTVELAEETAALFDQGMSQRVEVLDGRTG